VPAGTVTVRVENAYSDGHESQREVVVPAPGDDIELWWEEIVFPHTGDGHGIDSSLGSHYEATIIATNDPDLDQHLVGLSTEWS